MLYRATFVHCQSWHCSLIDLQSVLWCPRSLWVGTERQHHWHQTEQCRMCDWLTAQLNRPFSYFSFFFNGAETSKHVRHICEQWARFLVFSRKVDFFCFTVHCFFLIAHLLWNRTIIKLWNLKRNTTQTTRKEGNEPKTVNVPREWEEKSVAKSI